MRLLKVLSVITIIFIALYSCSSARPIFNYVEVTEKKTKFNKIQALKIEDSIKRQDKNTINSMKEETKTVKEDNLFLVKKIDALRRFIDSINKESNKLQRTNLISNMKILSDNEKLLIEKEARIRIQKENQDFKSKEELREKYVSIILYFGLAINIIFTISLYIYRLREVRKLSIKHA